MTKDEIKEIISKVTEKQPCNKVVKETSNMPKADFVFDFSDAKIKLEVVLN